MKKMRIKTSVLAVMLAALFAFQASYAYALESKDEGKGANSFENRAKEHEKKFDEMIAGLGLTPEQTQQIKALREKEYAEGKALRDTMKTARKDLFSALEKYETDTTTTAPLVEKLTSLEKQMLEQRVNGILAMKKVLTKEQFETMQAKMKAMFEAQKDGKKHHESDRGGHGGF